MFIMHIVLSSIRDWMGLLRCHRTIRNNIHKTNSVYIVVIFVSMVTTTLVKGSPPNRKKLAVENEPWLADGSFYDVDYIGDVPQADGRPIVVDMCPPVPKVLPAGGCDLQECRSDRECASRGLMCCYNGCVYTCLPEVKPPAYFDWLREPRRRIQFGSSWLIPGRDQVRDLISCTTTPPDDDSDPLMCPHGYQCVIDDQGIPAKGVPNTGHCVQSVDHSNSQEEYNFEKQVMPDAEADKIIPKEEGPKHHCKIDKNIKLISGHSVVLNGKNCLCYETKLMCEE